MDSQIKYWAITSQALNKATKTTTNCEFLIWFTVNPTHNKKNFYEFFLDLLHRLHVEIYCVVGENVLYL